MEGATGGSTDPAYQVKELVCQHISLEDLRSARLVSQDWSKAAASTVSTVVLQSVSADLDGAQRAYPNCKTIIIPAGTHKAGVDVGNAAQQHATSASSSAADSWPDIACFMLKADGQPGRRQAPVGRSWQQQWRLVIKPFAAELNPSLHAFGVSLHPGYLRACRALPQGFSTEGLLSHVDVPATRQQLTRCGQLCPEMTCLHVSLQHPVTTGVEGGLLGWGVLRGLTKLCLHSPVGHTIRILDYDLDLPQLQQLQFSGNVTLDMGPKELQLATSKLTSLSLQQTLDSIEAQNLFDSQPDLQYLSVLSDQSGQDEKYGSSVDSVRSLQRMVALVDEDPDVNEDLVFGPGSMGLGDAKKALTHVLTPPGRCTPESIAKAMLPSRRAAQVRHAAVAATPYLLRPAALKRTACPAHSAGSREAAGQCLPPDRQQGARLPARSRSRHALQRLTVHSGCWVHVAALLSLCSPEELLIFTLPAITDGMFDKATGRSQLGSDWFQVSAAYCAGAIPGAVRLPLPLGLSLRVLRIDTSRTAAGVEVDDQTLRAISISCKQLQVLEIRALLHFGAIGGAELHSLPCLQQLLLWDLRWQSVQVLMQLAANAPEDDMPDFRRVMLRLVQRTYFCFSACSFVITAALRGHVMLRTAALGGMVALALPVTAACSSTLVPLQDWQAARLCAAAVQSAGRPPFVLRACWLPPRLQRLQLHDCALRRHWRCPACNSSVALQDARQLQVEQLLAEGDSANSTPGGWSSNASKLDTGAAVRREIRSGRRDGLYPSLWGLLGKVLLAPAVPFAVTVAARAGLIWLAEHRVVRPLRGDGVQLRGLSRGLAGGSRHRHMHAGVSAEQLRSLVAALGIGI